jgi:hypothetical protein
LNAVKAPPKRADPFYHAHDRKQFRHAVIKRAG